MPFVEAGIKYGMPIVLSFFALVENPFLNTIHSDASGFEAIGNECLSSYHYIFDGREYDAEKKRFTEIYRYEDGGVLRTLKNITAIATLPLSLAVGSGLKGIGFLSEDARRHHHEIVEFIHSYPEVPHRLASLLPPSHMGSRLPRQTAEVSEAIRSEFPHLSDLQCQEVAALDRQKQKDLLALKALGKLLDAHGVAWWLDCGSLLGAYRHEGYIPWDHDIDIAILQEDHDLVFQIANEPAFAEKYRIMDWSPAGQPGTLLKLYIKETGSLLDLFHYRKEGDQIRYLSPYYDKWYMPQVLKIRERMCLITQPIEVLFPLKRAWFDGVEVNIPNQMETHLKAIYGDLSPSKVWNGTDYVNVAGHVYWAESEE